MVAKTGVGSWEDESIFSKDEPMLGSSVPKRQS